MRIAWLGPLGDYGGVPVLGTLLLAGLHRQGHEVDVFYVPDPEEVPEAVRELGVRIVSLSNPWSWNRWYSRTPTRALLSATVARSVSIRRVYKRVLSEHQHLPYDCLFQFSYPELLLHDRLLRALPPVVINPCTHAAGELHWHRVEEPFARHWEPVARRRAARLWLLRRSRRQARDLRRAARVVGTSEGFVGALNRDYGVPHVRLRVVRQPVDLTTFAPPRAYPKRRFQLLFASRISARKGVELVVALSHRLTDLRDRVRIKIVGPATLWSDYRAALEELSPDTAEYVGAVDHSEMPGIYAESDVLLVPSRYEPGSIAICEALASGVPVVASSAVGPAEVVDESCCLTFVNGDLDGFEEAVRTMLGRVSADRASMARAARGEAERLFAPELIAAQLGEVLAEVAG